MFAPPPNGLSYSDIRLQLKAMYGGYWLTNLANASAFLVNALPGLNWAGFYLMRGGRLELGPFQGLPACLYIPLNKGVCGAAASRRETMVVDDVHAFPGHIACDERSRSEIVVPLLRKGRLLGVLDLDAPVVARFGEVDRLGLEGLVADLVAASEWPTEF